MYTLSSNILKWSYNQKNEDGQHLEAVSHSIGYYSMGLTQYTALDEKRKLLKTDTLRQM